MHYLLYVTYFINVTHAYASGWPLFKTYWLKFRFGITGVKRFFFHRKRGDLVHPPNLTRALGKGRMSSFFFLLLTISFFLLLLPHALSDFDQTWSEWPLGESLQKLSTVWPQRSCRGHRGQKGHFKEKCYSSYMVHRILTKLGQNNQQASGYKSYQQFDPTGHVGVTGVKKVI